MFYKVQYKNYLSDFVYYVKATSVTDTDISGYFTVIFPDSSIEKSLNQGFGKWHFYEIQYCHVVIDPELIETLKGIFEKPFDIL